MHPALPRVAPRSSCSTPCCAKGCRSKPRSTARPQASIVGPIDACGRALAHAIAAATLRRLPDLDALIDSATKQNLPDDAKA
eukprot:gene92-137_t